MLCVHGTLGCLSCNPLLVYVLNTVTKFLTRSDRAVSFLAVHHEIRRLWVLEFALVFEWASICAVDGKYADLFVSDRVVASFIFESDWLHLWQEMTFTADSAIPFNGFVSGGVVVICTFLSASGFEHDGC